MFSDQFSHAKTIFMMTVCFVAILVQFSHSKTMQLDGVTDPVTEWSRRTAFQAVGHSFCNQRHVLH